MRKRGFGRGRKKFKARSFITRESSPIPRKTDMRSRTRKRINPLLIFSILLVILTVSIVQIDKRVFPQIYEIAHIKSKNKINTAINFSVSEISKELDLKAPDFYFKSFDESGRVCDVSVNTILVNEFCALLAERISSRLLHMGNEVISLPTGSLSGIRYFANLGPDYTAYITPMGDAYVNYDCSFESVGINQVNFQLWLIVDSTAKVVNPLQSQEITLSRKVALVNTVITGEVPDTYLNASGLLNPK